jgi:hypothetical protein
MKTEMGHLWQDSHDHKVMAWHLGHDIGYDAGQDNPDRSVWTSWPERSAWTARVGQDKEDGMPGHDKDRTLGQVSCGQQQDSWDRAGGTG